MNPPTTCGFSYPQLRGTTAVRVQNRDAPAFTVRNTEEWQAFLIQQGASENYGRNSWTGRCSFLGRKEYSAAWPHH